MEFEQYITEAIDQVKDFLFSDIINNLILNHTKNELLCLFFLYRNRQANMSQIADYLHAPLNTATGVVTRLVNKKMINRFRSEEDRRVVYLALTSAAREVVTENIRLIMGYITRVGALLSADEKTALLSVIGKVRTVILNPEAAETDSPNRDARVRKITIE